ncbi:MAG: insulinase family protein [Ruminococcaceae bacterium]|nr:insulinase family protein [Oscillospiraceae bacterium]
MSGKILNLANGVEGLFIKNERFNTTLISCNLYLPLNKDTVAPYALLPFVLTSCSEKYPDFSRLNYKLNRLYGARLDASTEKYGDYQLLKMTISVINDRFCLDGESLINQATELLLGLIFEPRVENGAFFAEDINREKRKAIEHIKGEFSEKRIYAKNRLIEEMYKNERYGLHKCGTVEDVEKITGESLFKAWQTALSHAFVRFQVVGAALPPELFENISAKFSGITRADITLCKNSSPTAAADKPQEITELADVTQGKLVMGFSSEICGNDDVSLPLLVMCDIFGGGPYSRLFTNVREKMSLCYYCSASSVRQKGLLTVESGVETQNAKKAEEEILKQLDEVKKGNFTDFEFESSIKSICDSLKGYNDSLSTTDLWYAIKVNNDNLYSPTDIAEKVLKITREDVITAANGIELHTVYKLLPKEEKK